MSTFPSGNFTIVNNGTGRCVRVRLGETKDVSDWKEGTKYLQSVTAKPTLELGEADGTPATAWWYHTADDAVERHPFNQIVSHAVSEYQNIGNYCVWLYSTPASKPTEDEITIARADFRNRLDSVPTATRDRLAHLLPEEHKPTGTEAERERKWWSWDLGCSLFEYTPDGLTFTEEETAAMRAYLKAVAEEGFAALRPGPGPLTRTEMDGCGRNRHAGISTYRWVYDGTYIYGADDTVPVEHTYWTDAGGSLVGRNKGEPGQKWTIAPWTPPAPGPDMTALALTGLFGPLGALFGGRS
ncbi:hypothetical protein ADK53_05000 [Streptomyces sp. WM6373]|uniref:hypothetical protein n=1 Tax=Streptomyces sp. WM6373 TaxID=1415556 RepID=UPI0006ADE017|nr:hypothetical protein [Streptomyces sp. WM6373]KOU43669.1 hypothetical protein ADK53_05000 [Streptomyces sp. WM6373]